MRPYDIEITLLYTETNLGVVDSSKHVSFLLVSNEFHAYEQIKNSI